MNTYSYGFLLLGIINLLFFCIDGKMLLLALLCFGMLYLTYEIKRLK